MSIAIFYNFEDQMTSFIHDSLKVSTIVTRNKALHICLNIAMILTRHLQNLYVVPRNMLVKQAFKLLCFELSFEE